MIKTSLKLAGVILAGWLLLPLSAHAFMIRAEQAVNVAKNQVIDGNFYAAGNSIIVDGNIKGDLICVGQSIVVNGTVDGDIICAGQSIAVLGPVGGNVRTAGNTININNTVARNIMSFGSSIILGANGKTGWDMLVGGTAITVNGAIGGNLHGGGAQVMLNGQVAKDVQVAVECLRGKKADQECQAGLELGDQAMVGGNLIYTAKGLAKISPQAQIKGEVKQQQPKNYPTSKQEAWSQMGMAWIWGKVIMIFAALLIGLILISLFKDSLKDVAKTMQKKYWSSLGYGVIVLLLTPLVALLLMFTLIGIPLAVLLLLSWIICLLVGKIIAAIVFGNWLFEKFKWQTKNSIWPMIVGVVIASLVFSIPIIGWIIALVALIWGLGGLWFGCKQHCK